MHAVDSGGCSLVVSLLFEPAARVAAQVEAPDLVVDEDRQHERDGGQPPHEPERNWTRYKNKCDQQSKSSNDKNSVI